MRDFLITRNISGIYSSGRGDRVVERKWSNKQEDSGRCGAEGDCAGFRFEHSKFKIFNRHPRGVRGRGTGWKYNEGHHQYMDDSESHETKWGHQRSIWKKRGAEDHRLSLRLSLGATSFRGQSDEDVPGKETTKTGSFSESIYIFNAFEYQRTIAE